MYDSRFDRTLSDILADQDQCMNSWAPDIKLEDPYAPVQQYQPTTTSSMLASPSMNMPVLCESYNPYLPSPQVVRSIASPSNTYVNSPADSSTYSVSPIESPQQPLPPEDFAHYMARQRQSYSAPPHVVPQSDYGYYGYGGSDCMGKRRLRDEELTQDEYEKRRLRRERNKQAALRCRNRRRERIEALEQETSEIEAQNEKVETDISKLQSQIKELKDILKGHVCQRSDTSSSDATQSKPGQFKVKPEPE